MTRDIGSYEASVAELCERALVTVIGHAGYWGEHLFLVGGLAPRYLTSADSSMAWHGPHAGTRDVDLAVVLAVHEQREGYETLMRAVRASGFRQSRGEGDPSFRWHSEVDGRRIELEFLGESEEVEPGQPFRPRQGAGSGFQVLNVPGVGLLQDDHVVVPITAERLEGGQTTVDVRVAGLLPLVVLKTRAYVSRQSPKDAYDLVYVLGNQADGPKGAGAHMSASPVAGVPIVEDAVDVLSERFAEPVNDAPTDYGRFMDPAGDPETAARFSNEAVAVVTTAVETYRKVREPGA